MIGRRLRSRVPRWLPGTVRRTLELLVLALVVEYLVLPQLAGTHNWLSLLANANWWWVAAALGAELASLVAFSLATRVLLPAEGRPRLWLLWRIDLAGVAVSHAVPGGAAAGTALGYRLLHRAGVDPGAATFAKLGQGAVSALVLQALLLSSLVIAIPLHGTSSLYLTAALIGAALAGAVVALTILLVRAEVRWRASPARSPPGSRDLPGTAAATWCIALRRRSATSRDTGGCSPRRSAGRLRTGCSTPSPCGARSPRSGTSSATTASSFRFAWPAPPRGSR